MTSALERAERAEARLRHREAMLESMERFARAGSWQLDLASGDLDWSPEIYRIHELDPGAGISLPEALSYYPAESRPRIEAAFQAARERGAPFDLTLPLVTARGTPRWVRHAGNPIHVDGRITHLRGALQDVTEAHEIQQRLVRGSRASAEGYWEYDLLQRTTWLSASFQALIGAEAQERTCTEQEFGAMVAPEDVGRVEAAMARHLATGAPYDMELQLIGPDGRRRWFRTRASSELSATGEPIRVGGSIVDIDRELATRSELARLRARHERAMRGTHDGLWDLDLVTGECWISPQFRVLLHYDPEDKDGLPDQYAAFAGLVHEDDKARLEDATRQLMEGKARYDLEFRLRLREGAFRWFRSRGDAERDASGRVIACSGSVQDIHDRKQAEFERAEAERRLARAIDGSADALFERDLQCPGPTWYSPRMREMLQYGPDDPFPDSLIELMNAEDREQVSRAVEAHETTGVVHESVFRLPTRTGELRWFRSRGRTERDESGKPRRYSGLIQDITAQREAEIALRTATEAADAANRAKGEFLANMSHEIRTPLNGVLGMTELLLEGSLEDDQRSLAETIRSSGQSLLAIINDLLDLSKIEAGKLTFEALPMDPRDSVRQTVAILEPQARKRGLLLRTDIAADVPHRVRGDPLRLGQILLNLAGNALKFTQSGEVSLRLAVAARREPERDTELVFEVRDTGIGMDAATLARLFTPFTQADPSTTRHYGGTGLGLSIVKRLLEQLGGSITVDSALGKGSSFRFRWPCTVLDLEAGAPTVATAATASTTAPADRAPLALGGRVLVVEDHPVNQQVVRRQLERLGCSVTIAENGALGVERARAERFDLILMDVQMPILDGLEATRRIRAGETPGTRVPIVAATASAMTDEIDRCRDAGMDDLVTKPIERARLEAILARYLATGRRNAPAAADLPVSGAAEASIDASALSALLDEDREFAVALITTFIASTREMLLAIEAAVMGPDRPRLATLGHKLLGAARSAGATEIADLAGRLEREAGALSPAALRDLGAALRRAYAATVAAFERLEANAQVA